MDTRRKSDSYRKMVAVTLRVHMVTMSLIALTETKSIQVPTVVLYRSHLKQYKVRENFARISCFR